MNKMARTFDVKIVQMRQGISVIPRQNLICNIPIIEGLAYKTKPYDLFGEDEPIDVINEWATDGGSTLNLGEYNDGN